MTKVMPPLPQRDPPGLFALGILWIFAACMTSLTVLLILAPGSRLGRLWALNPDAQREILPHLAFFAPVLMLVAVMRVAIALGWFRRRRWAWQLAVIVLAAQLVGGFGHVFAGYIGKGIVGILIPAALMFYLLRPGVRGAFSRRAG